MVSTRRLTGNRLIITDRICMQFVMCTKKPGIMPGFFMLLCKDVSCTRAGVFYWLFLFPMDSRSIEFIRLTKAAGSCKVPPSARTA